MSGFDRLPPLFQPGMENIIAIFDEAVVDAAHPGKRRKRRKKKKKKKRKC